jgi:anhydro-N-acetylmuramic acid kinase
MATKKNPGRLAVGLMSGTSMDGVDAALVEIRGAAERPRARLRAFVTLPYPPWVRERLLAIGGQKPTSAGEISRLNFLLGHIFGEAARRVMHKGRVAARRVSVVGSHGQTIYHQGSAAPYIGRRDLARSNTLQIAEPAVIAEMTGVPVVANFRTADMAAGGQGAPLVPMVDYLLLRSAENCRVALNIGGIANVTVIPAAAKPEDVFGFDTGPGNMVMDELVREFKSGRPFFDVGGRVASLGRVVEPLLTEALGFPFFSLHPPKSAGREQFGHEFVDRVLLRRKQEPLKHLLRTALELTARTVTGAINNFVMPRVKVDNLIVSGGGARNKFLMKRISQLLPEMKAELSDRYGLPIDAKEAIAFAVLADRTTHGLPGNLPSVTDARRAVVLGTISKP